jgi:hypothetical protein
MSMLNKLSQLCVKIGQARAARTLASMGYFNLAQNLEKTESK